MERNITASEPVPGSRDYSLGAGVECWFIFSTLLTMLSVQVVGYRDALMHGHHHLRDAAMKRVCMNQEAYTGGYCLWPT